MLERLCGWAVEPRRCEGNLNSRRDRKRPGATLIASLLESTVEKSLGVAVHDVSVP